MTRRLTLVVVGESRAPIELPQQGRLVIGSGDRAHVQLLGQGVADVHCAIGRIKGGGWALQDLGSEFGTLVNGTPVEAQRLDAGDELVLGSRRLRVVDPARPEAEREARPESPRAPEGSRSAGAPTPASSSRGADSRAAEPRGGDSRAVERRAGAIPRTEAPDSEGAPVLGGYRIAQRLGRGATGAVYLANQTSLDRSVALKVLSPRLAGDPRFVERFQAEARAAAALNHPNVVTVYDVGSDGGHHYLAMEYMDAGSLEAQLEERGPLPWREVLDALRDAAAGLVYAEQRRIVHRDIKPDNLMRNRDGVTKIADLGLAAQIEAEAQDDDHVSEGRRIFGTPHFIAPEVVRGGAADSRSDLYSLGATAYRLLSGHTPFEGATTRDILRGVLNDPAPPLDARVPGLPAGVARLVHRLLEKEPAARFPSAQLLLEELERLRRGDAGGPALPGAPRSRVPLVVGAALLVVGAIVAAQLLGGDGPADDAGDGDPARSSSSVATNGAAGSPGAPAAPGATDAGGSDGAGGDATPGAGGPEPAEASGAGAGEAPGRPSEAEFELRAELAYLQLRDRVLTEVERIAALETIAADFAGTDTARKAREDAAALAAAHEEAERARAARAATRTQLLTALRAAAQLDAEPFLPGRALRDMRLVPGLGEAAAQLGDDPELAAARSALVEEVLERGAAAARSALAAADEAAAAGDFDLLATRLRAVLPLGDLPPPEELPPLAGPEAPAGYAALRALVATAQERLDGLGSRREELAARAAQAAQAAAAEALGQGRGLEADLRRLDLDAAATRLERARAALGDSPEAAALDALAADVRAARAVLSALGAAWESPGWKRRSFADPRSTGPRPVTAEAIGADADGVLVDAGGRPERIPWAAFATQPRTIESLVNGRLEREWTADEKRGVAMLLRSAAVLSAIDEATEVLVPRSTAKFSPGEGEALLAGYRAALDWTAGLGDDAQARALDDEVRAAESLVLALRARSDGEWTRAAAAFERLLSHSRATLLVLLLSDGTLN